MDCVFCKISKGEIKSRKIYENENFFSMNEGLRSRFPFIYEINKYTASELTQMFLQKIQFNNWYTNVEQELLLELLLKLLLELLV